MVRNWKLYVAAAVLVSLVAGIVASARAATYEEIDAAVAKGQEFLFSKMKAAGRWEADPRRTGDGHDWETMQGGTYGGYTASAVYALLASGVRPQDERIQSAIEFLKDADVVGPYAVAMRAQVWTFLPRGPQTLRLYKHDLDQLMRTLNKKGPAAGLWDYQAISGGGTRIDHSVSQYGVLGLWACAQGGANIDLEQWREFDAVWREHQHPNGGWSYDGNGSDGKAVTHTMTAAGIATLYITQEFIPSPLGLNCIDNPVDEHIERGMRWFSINFKDVPDNNYLWYGIERIGAASGRKYFGDQDWYQLGAARVVGSQLPDGSWKTSFPGSTAIPDTAFALLFLSRGRAPIVMNKLDYTAIGSNVEAAGPWNRRPRDAANLAKWIARQGERYLGWQVVTLRGGHRDLLDAPILYLAGSEGLVFNEEEIAVMRRYVEDGGLILGNADCGKEEFVRAFRKLGAQLFPEYTFRELPATHPILAGQQFRAEKWKERVTVQGLSNGARELMVLIPSADAGRAWQQRINSGKEHLFQLGANIYFYATDKRPPRQRGDTHLVEDEGFPADAEIGVARIMLSPDSDPEPGGWRRLATLVQNDYGLGLKVQRVKLGEDKLAGGAGSVAHLTGTKAFELSAEQRDELKAFVTTGGTLLVDAAGGSAAFADAAQRELAATFGPDATKQLSAPLPLTHPLFANPAAPIDKVAYRLFAMERLTGGLKAPRVRGITSGGSRLGVIFSREDLSTGMVGQPVDGILGYDPATATAIVRNVVLLAARINKAATAARPVKPAKPLKRAPAGDGL
jgi:hypothetical protein